MRQKLALCLFIFLLALLVRAGGLPHSDIAHFPPAGMVWFDEGLKGVDAWRTLHGGGFKLVYPDVFPREPLLVWTLSVVLWLFGPKIVLLRLTVALISSLACVAFFLMVSSVEERRGRNFALVAAFILCTMHWHAWFGRLLFRTNFVPLLSCLVVLAMAAAARQRGRNPRLAWLAAGFVWGVGYYTYLSWHFFFPAVLFWFWVLSTTRGSDGLIAPQAGDATDAVEATSTPSHSPCDKKWVPIPWAFCFLIAGAVLVALPMALHYAGSSKDLTGRPAAISPLKDGLGAGIVLMLNNARDLFLMFGIRGDHVPLHNVSEFVDKDSPLFGKTGMPVFDPLWALFFFAGLLRAALDVIHGPDKTRRRVSAAWLVWFVCMSLPTVVTQTDSANTLRNLGATPSIAYFAATGWWWALEGARKLAGGARKGLLAFLIAALVWGAGFQVCKLWVWHPGVRGIEQAFNAINANLAWFCKRDAVSSPIYVPDMFINKSFEFLTIDRTDIHPFDPVKAFTRSAPGEKPLDHRILCTMYNREYPVLIKLFPKAFVEPDKLFVGNQPAAWMLRIPAAELLSPDKAAEAAKELARATRE